MIFIITLLVLAVASLMAWMIYGLAERWAKRMTRPLALREKALSLGPHGVMLCDALEPDLPILYVNRAFEKITGYSSKDILGSNSRFLEGTDRDQKGLQELQKAIREQRDCRVLLRNYRKDGTPFWNDLFMSPIRNDMGRVIQYMANLQDVTEREQTSRRLATESAIIRALAESPSLFEAAPRILAAICEAQEWDLGTFWRLDSRSSALQCVDQWHSPDLELGDFKNFLRETTFTRDMGVPGEIWGKGQQLWLPDLAHQDHLPEARLAIQAGLISACGFPIAGRRGVQGVLVFYSRRIWPLSKNLLLVMVGTGTQISQFMEREQQALEQKELTILERGMAEFMGEGLLTLDRDGNFIYVNATAGRLLGHPPKTLLGQNAHDALHPAGSGLCLPEACPIVLSLRSTRAVQVDDANAAFRCKDRHLLPVSYITSPIIDHNLIQGVVITFVDATSRRAQEEDLQQALAQKEEELLRIQKLLAQPTEAKDGPHPSELLIEKIKKLLG